MSTKSSKITLNDEEYHAYPVNFIVDETELGKLEDHYYLGKLTILNPDKTQNSMSNTLPEGFYKKGSYTPMEITDPLKASVNQNEADYILIGDICTVFFRFSELKFSTRTGGATIKLPFKSLGYSLSHSFSIFTPNGDFTAYPNVVPTLYPNLDKIGFKNVNGTNANFVFNPPANNLYFSITYQIKKNSN